MKTTKKPTRTLCRVVLEIFALLTLVVAASFLMTLSSVLKYSRADVRTPADVILVFGAAVWPGERPSPILLSRIQSGVELYKQGYADTLILSGGLGGNPPTEAEVMRRVAIQLGVPEAAILLEDQSHSTEQNVRNSASIMEARGWTSALLVSDPYHLYRACRMATDAGIDAQPVPVEESPGWTIPRLRTYYTFREVWAAMAYEVTRLWR
jgi:uncharacterized SAM-binding protein YcdF (DUF218 family)